MSPSRRNRQRDLNEKLRRLIRQIFLFTALISFLTIMGSFYLFGQPSTRLEVAAIVVFPMLLSWLTIDNHLDTLELSQHLSHDQ